MRSGSVERRSTSFRQSLLRNLGLVILLLSAGILATSFFLGRRTVESMSRSFTEQAIDRVSSRLHGFFDPIDRNLEMARAWGEAGLLEGGAEELDRLLLPLLRQHSHVSSVILADERGRETMLQRVGEGWRSREMRLDEWGKRGLVREWSDGDPQPTESQQEFDYDPTARPWYRGALEQHGAAGKPSARIHWTAPYIFFSSKEPGITASLRFDSGDGLERVIAFDVLLRDISRFTKDLRVGEEGRVFVVAEDGAVVGLPWDPRLANAEARRAALLEQPEQLGIPIVSEAARHLRGDIAFGDAPQPLWSGGQRWWGKAEAFALSARRSLWIVVTIPESELLGEAAQLRLWIAPITLGVLLFSLLLAARLARRYSSPIEALVQASERISRGNLEPGEPVESAVTEVRRLARAQDHMRAALEALFKLERDLQVARQIQVSTLPDRLPQLRGFEIEAWTEPAEETGGDSYDVIGYRGTRGDDGPVVVSADHADRAVLLVADATGHGIGPALSVTQIRAMLRMAVRTGEPLETIAGYLNEQLFEDLSGGRFITAWLADLDASEGTLTSFSAGQAPILHYRASENRFDVSGADAPPFGIVADLDVGSANRIRLKSGDVFVVLSDGIFEATDPNGDQFGSDRVQQVIEANRRSSPREILGALRAELSAFTADAPAKDDRTALIIKCVGKAHR